MKLSLRRDEVFVILTFLAASGQAAAVAYASQITVMPFLDFYERESQGDVSWLPPFGPHRMKSLGTLLNRAENHGRALGIFRLFYVG